MMKSMQTNLARATQRALPRNDVVKAPSPKSSTRRYLEGAAATASIVAIGLFEVATTGALNGGSAPPAGPFTALKTWLQTSFLGSDWVLLAAFVGLVVLVWSLMHGKGWGGASSILGMLAVALVGPTAIVALATSTRPPVPSVAPAVQAAMAAPIAGRALPTLTAVAASHV